MGWIALDIGHARNQKIVETPPASPRGWASMPQVFKRILYFFLPLFAIPAMAFIGWLLWRRDRFAWLAFSYVFGVMASIIAALAEKPFESQ